jgi:phenylacetate-CoA ligase
MLQVRPKARGVLQAPPLPVVVELGENFSGMSDDLAGRIADEIRSRLLVTTDIRLVSYGTLPRETYKSKLIDYSDVEAAQAVSA